MQKHLKDTIISTAPHLSSKFLVNETIFRTFPAAFYYPRIGQLPVSQLRDIVTLVLLLENQTEPIRLS